MYPVSPRLIYFESSGACAVEYLVHEYRAVRARDVDVVLVNRQEALDELKRLVANNPDIREIMKGIDEVIDGEVVRDAIGEAPSE